MRSAGRGESDGFFYLLLGIARGWDFAVSARLFLSSFQWRSESVSVELVICELFRFVELSAPARRFLPVTPGLPRI